MSLHVDKIGKRRTNEKTFEPLGREKPFDDTGKLGGGNMG